MDPRYLFLSAFLRARGLRVSYNCKLSRNTTPRMKELNVTAPLLITHHRKNRRMVISIGNGMEAWRTRLAQRHIDLLCVSADGLTSNAEGLANMICHRMYKIDPDDLKEFLDKGLSIAAIAHLTQLSETEIFDKIRLYFRVPVDELCGQLQY